MHRYDINISYYVMQSTYSRSRFWFGIWACTLVICEKTFGRKEEMLKSRCFKQSAILWRDFCFFFWSSQDKAMRLRAVRMLRLERWRLKAWFPSGYIGVEVPGVQEIEIRGVVETGGITKLWPGFHPCNQFFGWFVQQISSDPFFLEFKGYGPKCFMHLLAERWII